MTALIAFAKHVFAVLLNPFAWVLMAIVGGIAGVYGYWNGQSNVQGKWDLERAEIIAGAAEDARNRAAATVKVVTRYVERVTVVKEKADEVVNQVPGLVPADAVVPAGFVCIHDRAAANDPGAPCEPGKEATAARAAEAVARNYGRYHELAEQVNGLLDYIDKVCKPEPGDAS